MQSIISSDKMTENVQRQYVHLRKRRIMEYLQNAPAELASAEDNNKEAVVEMPEFERKLVSVEDNNNKEEVVEMSKFERKLLSQDELLVKNIEDATNSTQSLEEKQLFIKKYLNETIEGGLEKFVSPMETKDFTFEELIVEMFLLECILMDPTSSIIDEILKNIDEGIPDIDEALLNIEKKENKQIENAEEKILQDLESKITVAENQEKYNNDCLKKVVEETQKLQNKAKILSEGSDFILKNNIEVNQSRLLTFLNSEMLKRIDTKPIDVFNELQSQAQKVQTENSSIPIVKTEKVPKKVFETTADGTVVLGPNGTKIGLEALQAINWSLSGPAITRKILVKVFSKKILASHNLTGKPSPAFLNCDKPTKGQLNPQQIADVLHFVMQHTQLTEKEVRNAIITKCADEHKMYRQKKRKKLFDAPQLQ